MRKMMAFLYDQKVAPYVFILPFVLTFLIFFIYPVFTTIQMSFQDILPGMVTNVGFKNYQRLLGDRIFRTAVSNSLLYTFWTLALLIPFPLAFACMLNSRSMIGRGFFRTSLFVPVVISVVVAGTIFRLMFGEVDGSFMNTVRASFGLGPIKWLKVRETGLAAMVLMACWRWTGINMLYFLSGLKSIPPEMYESAEIDGASVWQKFRHISVPLVKPTIIYVLTISIYGGLAMFTESYMLWAGNSSPKNIGLTIVGYLYRQGWEQNRMGYASAVGLVLLTVAMVINLGQLRLTGVLGRERD
ncbi:MAG TPA: sugar ABC transporter permease [Limnochordia bacterium]|nr:sugar ABC transporter permease [Limnochordia bacterium]HKM42785.1 sugar ABC transporter permease [Limnochordia bacterium]